MASGTVDVTVAATPEVVWTMVGDFGGVVHFVPGIDSLRLEGDTRIVGMFGAEVREKLLSRDEDAMMISYSVIDEPIESHRATITVEPIGQGSKVTWAFEVLPDEMAPILADIYEAALASLQRMLA